MKKKARKGSCLCRRGMPWSALRLPWRVLMKIMLVLIRTKRVTIKIKLEIISTLCMKDDDRPSGTLDRSPFESTL